MSAVKSLLHRGFVMRVWPSFYSFLRKMSVVERCLLYRMSAIGGFTVVLRKKILKFWKFLKGSNRFLKDVKVLRLISSIRFNSSLNAKVAITYRNQSIDLHSRFFFSLKMPHQRCFFQGTWFKCIFIIWIALNFQ